MVSKIIIVEVLVHNYARLSAFQPEKLDIYLLFGWENVLMSFQWEISQAIWFNSSKNLTSKDLRADVDIDRECFPYIQESHFLPHI